MTRYLSGSDCPAPGTLCGIQEPAGRRQGELPEIADISSSNVVFTPAHQPQLITPGGKLSALACEEVMREPENEGPRRDGAAKEQ